MPETRHSFLPELRDAAAGTPAPDRRDGAVYVLEDQLRLAVDVALATGRPLLLRGEPGSGKSSLAAFLARNLGWRYYEHVVSSRTTAQDLLWSFDSMRRLADASARDRAADLDDAGYLEPGVMWWVLNRSSALRRGPVPDEEAGVQAAPDPGDHDTAEPFGALNADRDPEHAVVLIDEIDKADPDVPNGLLVPLGSTEFLVTPIKFLVKQAPTRDDQPHHLIVITTNEERELPPAFLRRCIVHTLTAPERETLLDIARRHLALDDPGPDDDDPGDLLGKLAAKFSALRIEAKQHGERPPSTAEFLDAVRVCRRLRVTVDDETWRLVEPLVLLKNQSQRGSGP